MGEGGFEVVHDFQGDDSGGGEVRRFLQGVVFEPEDVEVRIVALGQLVVGEGFEPLALLAVVAAQSSSGGTSLPLCAAL